MKQTLEQSIAGIGDAIEHSSGIKMIKDYRDIRPDNVSNYLIGVDIITAILSQPGCVGIRFYNAMNGAGEQTLVYVGVNADDKAILEYVVIGDNGELVRIPGIVADRIKPPPRPDTLDEDGWGLPE